MSNVIIKRAVENIRRGTSVYTPIIELVVNSIQAIEEKGNGSFKLEANQGEEKDFTFRVFKIYSANSQSSKRSLVTHRREVTSTSTYHYIPEFSEEFFDSYKTNGQENEANYIIKVYRSEERRVGKE